MRRFLIIVLALLVGATALAAPAYACPPMQDTVSMARHDCCDGPVVSPAPVGTCCVISAPIQRASSTESRPVVPDQSVVVLPRVMADGCRQPDVGRDISRPALVISSVPLYLQQLSLLI